jgi:type IV pilus assembly protein PilC
VALRRHPRHFDAFYVQLVHVGEATGKLAEMLFRIADAQDTRSRHRQQLRQALVYPAFVCTVAIGIALALMIWAVPAFQPLFDGFGTALPPLTRAVLALSDGVARYGPALIAAMLIAGGGIWMMARQRLSWRYALHDALLRLPFFGPLRAKAALAQWAHGLSTLLLAGTPLVDALLIQSHAPGLHTNRYERISAQLARGLGHGEKLSSAMRQTGCFTRSVIRFVEIAEYGGSLDTLLSELGRRSADEVETRTRAMMGCVEPAVIALCGGFVAILVIALYLPIIELGNVV